MKFIRVGSLTLQRLLANPAFRKRLARPVKLNFKYDVPYLAGYSRDGKTIYVDRHLRRYWRYRGRIIDVVDYLVVHEVTEKALIDLFKLNYQKAHHIAEHVESLATRQNNINWWAYSRFLKPQIKTAYVDQVKRIPPDLDLTPYEDEHEQKVLVELQRKHRKYVKENLTYNPHLNNMVKYVGGLKRAESNYGSYRNLYPR